MKLSTHCFLPFALALGLLTGCSERNAEQEYTAILSKELTGDDPATLTNQYTDLIGKYGETETATRARERLIALNDKLREQRARADLKAEFETRFTQWRADWEKAGQQTRTEQDQRQTRAKADAEAAMRKLKEDLEANQRELAAEFDTKLQRIQSRLPPESAEAGAAGGTEAVIWGIGGNNTQPDYMRNPRPPYPREAREKAWQGTTQLRVEVLADGTAGKVEVAKSSGQSVLDQASVDTVRRWKFSPARSGDIPIRSTVEIPIVFRLTE